MPLARLLRIADPFEELLVKRDRSLIDQSLHARQGDDDERRRLRRGVVRGRRGAAALPEHPSRVERPQPPRARRRDLLAAVLRAYPRLNGHCDPGDEYPSVPLRQLALDAQRLDPRVPAHEARARARRRRLAVPSIEGTTDSEAMFYLALTFGLESDPVAAVERMVGFVEETGHKHGIEHPIQMTIATTDGRASGHSATRARATRAPSTSAPEWLR